MKLIDDWDSKLVELYANRVGRVPIDKSLEDKIVTDLEAIFIQIPEEDRSSLERPESPLREVDLIALNHKGQLVGFEDLDD